MKADEKNCLFIGNHESVTMNQMYGFEGEVKEKYVLKISIVLTPGCVL